MYQALYRKWRPRVFEDVAGQPNITETLKNEITAGRIAHAYIFTGSRGTGKTTCAKILAKAVNCLDLHDGDPCNECKNCRGIDNGSLLDVVEIDAASNNGVDNIRDLRDETNYTPANAKYRVYIIDEAHMLSNGAFNALLKTLEEPPAYVIFILATTEIHKIPATILSRCQRFDFKRIPNEDIVARLKFVAGEEKIDLDDNAAEMIARLSDGALRNALSLLDQCASSEKVDEAAVEAAAGITDKKYLFEISTAVANCDAGSALKVIDSLYSMSKDVERLCDELVVHFRDIMIVRSMKNPYDIVLCRNDEKENLGKLAKTFSDEALLHAIDTLESTLESIKRGASGRVTIETALLRLCNPSTDTSVAALLRRIEALEAKLAGGVPVKAVAASDTKTETTGIPEAVKPHEAKKAAAKEIFDNPQKAAKPDTPIREAKETPKFDPGDNGPLSCWPEIVEAIRKDDAPLFGVLKDSTAAVRDGYVLVDSDNGLFADFIKRKEHQKPLISAIRSITGKPYKVGISKRTLDTAKEPQTAGMDELLNNARNIGVDVTEQ